MNPSLNKFKKLYNKMIQQIDLFLGLFVGICEVFSKRLSLANDGSGTGTARTQVIVFNHFG